MNRKNLHSQSEKKRGNIRSVSSRGMCTAHVRTSKIARKDTKMTYVDFLSMRNKNMKNEMELPGSPMAIAMMMNTAAGNRPVPSPRNSSISVLPCVKFMVLPLKYE
jgi:hypothetical protein